MEMTAYMKEKITIDKDGIQVQFTIPRYVDNFDVTLINLSKILPYDRLHVEMDVEVPEPDAQDSGADVTVTLNGRQARMFN